MKVSGVMVGLLLSAGVASAASLEDEGYPALFVTGVPETGAAPTAAAAPVVEAAPVVAEAPPTDDLVIQEYIPLFYDPANGELPAVDPSGTAPVVDVPVSDVPVGDARAGDAPAGDARVDGAPAGEAPVADAAVVDSPTGDAPASEAPAGDASVADTGEGSAGGTAVAPAADAPAEAIPDVIDPAVAEAQAKRREELRSARGPYAGINGGSDHVTLAGIDDGTANGLLVGYRITEMFAAELALNTADYTTPVANCFLDNITTGLYAAARTGVGPGGVASEAFYLKGRIGALAETLDSVGNCAGAPKEEVLPSAGVGVGVRLGAAAIEFEYTLIEEDIYRLGWSVMLNF